MIINRLNTAFLDYSDIYSGAERSLFTLIKYLDKKKAVPILVCLYPRKHLNNYEPLNVPIFYLADGIKWWMGKDFSKRAPRGSDFIKRLIFACKLTYLLKKNKTNILHINLMRIDSFWYVFLPKLFGIKVIIHARSYPGWIPSKFLIRFSDYIFCMSDIVKHNYLEKQKTNSIITVYDGIEIPTTNYLKRDAKQILNLDLQRNYISSVGMLQEHKGHDTAIFVFSKLSDTYPDFDLIIAGGGSEVELIRLMSIVKNLGIQDRVIFTKKQISNIEFVYMASEIILSLTKNGEAFGRIPFEGASYQVPVIAPNIGAAPELITNEVNGILVNPLDEIKIKYYIEKLISDTSFKEKIVKNGYQLVVSRLNPKMHAKIIVSKYSDIIIHC